MPQYASKSVYVFKMSWKWPISAPWSPSFCFWCANRQKWIFSKIFFLNLHNRPKWHPKKGEPVFSEDSHFFLPHTPTPSYIFSIEKRKKSKNRPKRKLKKKIFPQLGILGNFFCVFPWCWRLLFIKNWVVIEQFRVHRFFWQNLLAYMCNWKRSVLCRNCKRMSIMKFQIKLKWEYLPLTLTDTM